MNNCLILFFIFFLFLIIFIPCYCCEVVYKEERFNNALQSAKKALDSIDMPFHLHAGTALGAHREKTFIKHDHDIDIAVFYKDASTDEKLEEIKKVMKENGFMLKSSFGKLERGKELSFFYKNLVPLDIFWIYSGKYKGKDINWNGTYLFHCNKFPYKTCVFGYEPYKTESINLLGSEYQVIPKKTLKEFYGNDWKIPRKFNYLEGLQKKEYKALLKDYFNQI